MKTLFFASLLLVTPLMADGPSETISTSKSSEYEKVTLGKYRIGETLEQCRTRYGDTGRDLPEAGWKEFKKGDFYVTVHFNGGRADEIRYKHLDEGQVIPLEESERKVLLSYNGEHWSEGEHLENVLVFVSDLYSLVAQYGLKTTPELDAGVMTIYTREREAERRKEDRARTRAARAAMEEAARQRLKGL